MESETKHCPFCDERISKDAKKCKYCGEWLLEEDQIAHEEPTEERDGYIVGALVGVIIAAISCTWLWTLIVGWTNYESDWYAIAVGAIVGFSVRWIGRGETVWFGIIAAVCALISCFMGEYLSGVGIDGMSVLYYVIAVVEAYFVARNQSDND